VQLCASEAIFAEYDELLQRRSFPLDRRRSRLLLKKLRIASRMFKPAGRLAVASDPDDNMFLECAQAAKAHYLVTGNTDHFPKDWKCTKIVTPRGFINVWKDLYGGRS
jgi:putative PIN family toxin of toxin-antitoxin system